ncbi:ribonuclease HII [Candidatus Omnitrophota bacterium]
MRKNKMLIWEKKAFLDGASIIVGLDEAGRGPLAGPVVAAALILKPSPLKRFTVPSFRERIDDSKKMRPKEREKTFCEISKKSIFGVGLRSHSFIDRKNIYCSTCEAMRNAVRALIKEYCRRNNKKEWEIKEKICVLVDGNMKVGLPYRTVSIIKGDSKSLSIAAASIVAKVTRDRLMEGYDKRFPLYGFSHHKGYGTRSHLDAIQRYGPCSIHRKSFAPIRKK